MTSNTVDPRQLDSWIGESARAIRDFDWSTTPLGPIDTWPQVLRSAVQIMLRNALPMAVLWGEQGTLLYNDAYAQFSGGRHPGILGMPIERAWPEAAAFNRNVVESGLRGETLSYLDIDFVLPRAGREAHVWLDLHYSPVASDEGVPLGVLAVVVETTVRVTLERTRAEAEAAFRAADERLQLALNSGAVLGTFVWEIQHNRVKGDERFARTFLFSLEQVTAGLPIERAFEIIHPDDVERITSLIARTVRENTSYRAEYRIRTAESGWTWIMASGRCEYDETGRPMRFPGVIIDIHDRKVAEEKLRELTHDLEDKIAEAVAARTAVEAQLRQSLKMEALGAMTGGVAHDFNNTLQAISGNLQLLQYLPPADKRVPERLQAAMDAVQRGAKLASQLLSFARRQPQSPVVINPRRLFDELRELLQHAVGASVTIGTMIVDEPWNFCVDRNQLENALLNLAINARDAMRGDGKFMLASSNEVLDAAACEGKELRPGEYVRLSASDTGTGMPPEVLERAFEPFFTTKPEGHGTGLGLSMVFGFVKQSGGHIAVSSTVDVGTTVDIFFPRSHDDETAMPRADALMTQTSGATVLVVDDDASVLSSTVAILEVMRYTVLRAANGDAAMSVLESGVHVDLILTDVVMPGKVSCADLAEWAFSQTRPVPVIYASGYTRDMISRDSVLRPNVTLLNKPYRAETLAREIAAALNG
ncbi:MULTISPECIES: ATP-binding protein [unclassified Caballeronia]|uniref:hybrid sensor histidine kinase/response regulator n=1 Tax=unclassified Caballeronia TaxID=2646786 RepID=UPI002857326E|nr:MULTISPECIES: ATP-binding protein [unclassified Caballeronia]MDR5817106.1 ATP-binding protein [Caballeronia sp. LZ033]MDR5824013.1 ATP-binding protein [Caballeronia sp. LZ043]